MLSLLFIICVFTVYYLKHRKITDYGESFQFPFTPKNLIGLGIVIAIAIVLFLI